MKRKKYKPEKAIPGCCGGTKKMKERSEAKEEDIVGRVKALADDRERGRKNGRNGEERRRESEKK